MKITKEFASTIQEAAKIAAKDNMSMEDFLWAAKHEYFHAYFAKQLPKKKVWHSIVDYAINGKLT